MKTYHVRQRIAAEDVVLEEFDDLDGRPHIIDRAPTADELLARWNFGPAWRPTTEDERASHALMANVLYVG